MSSTILLRRLVVGAALAAASLALGVGAGCKSNSIASVTNNGAGVIGANGGVVSLDDGTEVRIPA